MNDRIEPLKFNFRSKNIGAFLVTEPANLFYLTGYTGSNGMLIVINNHSKPIFYTDFRYQEQVKSEVKNCQIKIWNRNLFSTFPVEVLKGIERLGFESNNLTYTNYSSIKKQLKGKTNLVANDNSVECLRKSKDQSEIDKIRKAVAVTDKVFQNVLTMIKPNITEKDLATEIDYQFTKHGSIAFPTIVAFAEHGALPHAQPTNKKIKSGDAIVFDIGAKVDNYCSDMTRTVVFGKASSKVKNVYEIVLSAQKLAEEKIQASKLASDIDGIARNYIKEKGFGKFFGHSLGHGVGIMVHEGPTLGEQSKDLLKTNQVVSVEPGIYLPNEFGVRIEDLVIIKENNCEILTKSSKELIEL